MNFQRRPLVSLMLAVLAGGAAGGAAAQATHTSKPVTLIVPTSPGGTTDIAARLLADPLGKTVGQTVIVDNRGGASGGIAAVAVKRAEPDGHTPVSYTHLTLPTKA